MVLQSFLTRRKARRVPRCLATGDLFAWAASCEAAERRHYRQEMRAQIGEMTADGASPEMIALARREAAR